MPLLFRAQASGRPSPISAPFPPWRRTALGPPPRGPGSQPGWSPEGRKVRALKREGKLSVHRWMPGPRARRTPEAGTVPSVEVIGPPKRKHLASLSLALPHAPSLAQALSRRPRSFPSSRALRAPRWAWVRAAEGSPPWDGKARWERPPESREQGAGSQGRVTSAAGLGPALPWPTPSPPRAHLFLCFWSFYFWVCFPNREPLERCHPCFSWTREKENCPLWGQAGRGVPGSRSAQVCPVEEPGAVRAGGGGAREEHGASGLGTGTSRSRAGSRGSVAVCPQTFPRAPHPVTAGRS